VVGFAVLLKKKAKLHQPPDCEIGRTMTVLPGFQDHAVA
jgi:hypothetical protein